MTLKTCTKPEDYIFASSRVRMYDKRLLSREETAQFMRAESYEEALKLLRESAYGNRLDSGDLSYEDSLSREAERLRLELGELVPGSPLLRLMYLDDLYHDLKALVKMVLLDLDLAYLLVPLDIANLTWLQNLLERPELNRAETPEELTLLEVSRDYEKHHDPERLELIIDRGLYRDKQAVAEKLGSSLILDWLREQVDFINLIILLRMRRVKKHPDWYTFAMLEGGRIDRKALEDIYMSPDLPTGRRLEELGATDAISKAWQKALEENRPAVMEKARDEQSLVKAEEAAKFTYGPEVLFAYYLQRSLEIQNLRTLMMALRNGMSAEERREHLRIKP
ncbi:MAG: V-type ATPase subunit [Eubacteriales bacterium]|nr:V-type ATPase subunit [Eubacteriales bacterium]